MKITKILCVFNSLCYDMNKKTIFGIVVCVHDNANNIHFVTVSTKVVDFIFELCVTK